MDSSGPWAVHARAQIHKILENEGLQVVGGKK
jgi:hypothetical protein